MFKKLLIVALLISVSQLCQAQEVVPTLTGTVAISVEQGTFTCDLVLADIPRVQDYYIRLNAGINIFFF